MPNIALFQYDLGIGGIQKAVINLVSNIDTDYYKIDLYLFTEDDFFEDKLPKNVNVIRMPHFNPLCKVMPFGLVSALFKGRFQAITKEYDVAVDFNSFQPECALGALTVKAKKRVMWIHTDVDIKLKQDKKYRILWSAFKSKFKRFDGFVPVSSGLIEPFVKRSGVSDKPFTVVGNFVDADEIVKRSEETVDFTVDEEKINLISVGRLCPEKAFDELLTEFKKALSLNEKLHLYIMGGGDEREKLEALTKENGLSANVTFTGAKPNPFPYEKQMDAFVLMSKYEGQGIVFLEALCIGLPLIFPKRLEKYLDGVGVTGTDDIALAISRVQKAPLAPNTLAEYNENVRSAISELFEVSNEKE